MMNLICFSKDRPSQLLAFLNSAVLHTRGLFNSYNVLYLATSKPYEDGYNIVRKQHPYVNFVSQTIFKDDVLRLMGHDYTCFAADDDIVYKDIDKAYRQYMSDSSILTFSFRLGTNIKRCYPMNKDNSIKNYEDLGNIIKWDWTKEEMDFAYPLSTISHVFRTEQYKAMIEQVEFSNLNELEAGLQKFNQELAMTSPYMVSYKTSKMFGVPANRVNTSNDNRNGIRFSYPTEELNKLLLSGEYIDINRLNYSDVNSAQYELEYQFDKWL